MISDPAEIYLTLKGTRPAAARLAIVSSLPVRVSPSLLRVARLRLVDDGAAGTEADLWLSDLVEARSAAGFSYRPEVREFLPEQLAGVCQHRRPLVDVPGQQDEPETSHTRHSASSWTMQLRKGLGGDTTTTR